MMRGLERLGSAIAEQKTITGLEFIALGVTAKVVVIVQNENLRLGSRRFPKEVCRRKAADTAANDDQVVGLVVGDGARELLAIAKGVRHLPGTVMAAAQAVLGRRVVIRILFGLESRLRDAEGQPGKTPRNCGGADRDADTVEKVPPGDRTTDS